MQSYANPLKLIYERAPGKPLSFVKPFLRVICDAVDNRMVAPWLETQNE